MKSEVRTRRVGEEIIIAGNTRVKVVAQTVQKCPTKDAFICIVVVAVAAVTAREARYGSCSAP